MERLQKYLAACGVASRRAAEKMIEEGRVTVNGVPGVVGQSVCPQFDLVAVDGAAVRVDGKVYVVLNKPANTVTTAKDTHGRKTVLDLVQGAKARVFPVGRLDMDVEGVLLMMNDGELAHRLIHPRYEVEKIYLATVKGHVQFHSVERLRRGVHLEDGMTSPAGAEIVREQGAFTVLRLTLHEGRKHEVKRMCAAVGHPIRSLQRVAFGGIRADGLRPGEWRYMTETEVLNLYALTTGCGEDTHVILATSHTLEQ